MLSHLHLTYIGIYVVYGSPEFLPDTIAVFAFSGFSGFPVIIILLSRLLADSFLLRALLGGELATSEISRG